MSTGRRTLAGLSLTTRTFLVTSGAVIGVSFAALALVAVTNRRTTNETDRRGLEQSADLVAQFLAGRERTLEGGARVFVQGPYFRTLVAARRRDDVLDQALEAADQIDADWVFITDENGVMIAKSDETGVTGVPMGQVPLIAGALRGQVNTGFGASGDTMVFQAVAVPISAKAGAPAGVLVAARVIDSLFLHDVKAATSSDLLFFTRDERKRDHAAASTVRASAATLSAFLAARATSDQASARAVALGNAAYLSRGAALSTAGGDVIGGFVVLREHDAVAGALAGLALPIAVVIVAALGAGALAAMSMSRSVTRPAEALASSVRDASNGVLPTSPLTTTAGTPELQALAFALNDLLHEVRDKEALIAVARVPAAIAVAAAQDDTARPARALTVRGATSRAPLPRTLGRPGLLLDPGAVLANRYVIDAELGRGGLGIVYRAVDRVIGEPIAIKVLRPEIVMADGGAFEQLKAELRITRRLSHRNIVRTHDIGEADGVPFLTMEYVDGASLATVIHARGALARPAVIAIAKQLLGALAVAHDRDIVHGDLKPQNILVDASGVLRVTDFGVARLVRGARPATRDDASANPTQLRGATLGTPEYMAPEQLIGEPSSVRTDLYAAGIVLQECLSGTTPYGADTPVAFVAQKLSGPDPRDRATAARDAAAALHARDAAIAPLLARMAAPDADDRPVSARHLLHEFAQLG